MRKISTRAARAASATPPGRRVTRSLSALLVFGLLAPLLVQLMLGSGQVEGSRAPDRVSLAAQAPRTLGQPQVAPAKLAKPKTPTPTRAVSPTATATETATVTPTVKATETPAQTPGVDPQPALPLRAAFYYPWFPNAWTQGGVYPYTNYHPSLGFYDGGDPAVIKQQIAAMQYGGIAAGILSWWGQGHHTDARIPTILAATAGSAFRWGLYYEAESQGDPSAATIAADLAYLRDHYGSDPSFLRINGRFVVFVYADGNDACGMADRWAQASAGINAYIVLKVFPGYAQCASQPAGWHQYAPAAAADSQGSYSYTISPGFYKIGEAVRLARDLARWRQNVRDMIASGANFQLVTSFNEWGEGTAVESAAEWTSQSGHGAYLDALHDNGAEPQPGTETPLPPTETPTSTPTSTGSTLTFAPVADTYVDAGNPTVNYGQSTALRADGSPDVRSFLRFSVLGLSGAVTSATLRIYANSSQSTGYTVSQATGIWTETGVTYNNQPGAGAAVGTSGPVTGGAWTEVDVTSAVTGSGDVDFVISTTSLTALSLSSREGAQPPQLVVRSGSGGATNTPEPATATPTSTKTPAPATATPTPTNTPAPATATPTPTNTPAPPSPTPTATSTSVPPACTSTTLTKGPTLILTGQNTEMKVFWQWTDNSAFTLRWGTSTAYGQGSAAVAAYDTTNHLYAYTITGLTPGTKYYYQVAVSNQCASYTFYAPPAATASGVKFLSYGDTRTNGSVHNGLAGQVVSLFGSDPAFQTLNLNVGDWVSGDSESAWTGEWYNTSYANLRAQEASIADTGVRGNHESGATYWKRYFPQPYQAGGLYRSFDYGPMHIAMLDQYTAYNAGSTQYNWLKNDLAASTKTWKLVVLHEPGWSSGGGHGNNTTVQNDLEPLFKQYGVSIVFGGHNHYYARATVDGIQHLTMGGGGAPLYAPGSGYPNIVASNSSYSFGQFTISGNTLTAKVVNNSGATIDSFTITR